MRCLCLGLIRGATHLLGLPDQLCRQMRLGWLVGWSNLGGSPTLQPADFSAQSATANSNTHTHACAHTHTQTHIHNYTRKHKHKHELLRDAHSQIYIIHILVYICNVSSQMYPNSDFVISNSYSDVNLRSSLFSKNVNTR